MFQLKVRFSLIYCFRLCIGGAPLRLRLIVVVFYLLLSVCCHHHFATGVTLLTGKGTTEASLSTEMETRQAAESFRLRMNYFMRPLFRRQSPLTPMGSLRVAVAFRPLVLLRQTPIYYLERKPSNSNSPALRYYRLMDGRPSWLNDIQEVRSQSGENDPRNDEKLRTEPFGSPTRTTTSFSEEQALRTRIISATTIRPPASSLFRIEKRHRLCGKTLTNEIKRLCTPNGYSLVCIHSSADFLALIKRDERSKLVNGRRFLSSKIY